MKGVLVVSHISIYLQFPITFMFFNRFSSNSRLNSDRLWIAAQSNFLDFPLGDQYEFNLKIHNISKVKQDFLLVVSCEIFQCMVKSYRIEEISDRYQITGLLRERQIRNWVFFARKCGVQNRMLITVFGIKKVNACNYVD